MKSISDENWRGGYKFKPFDVRTTNREFVLSRRNREGHCNGLKGSNMATVFNPWLQETLINGVLQGRKQTDPRGASAICNAQLWKTVIKICALMALPVLHELQHSATYRRVKESRLFESRREVKEEVKNRALTGWIRNEGDDFDVFS